MKQHYYTEQPDVKSERRQIHAVLRGREYRFWVDNGVFAKSGIDFGTRLLAESMQLPRACQVLDLGCGYGPLGIVAAALDRENRVWMVDVNERAVALARENAILNRVQAEVLASDGFAAVEGMRFDAILLNPPIRAGKEVVFSLYEDAYGHLREGGRLWVVIQKKQGAPSTQQKLNERFGEKAVVQVTRKSGYLVLAAKKANVEF